MHAFVIYNPLRKAKNRITLHLRTITHMYIILPNLRHKYTHVVRDMCEKRGGYRRDGGEWVDGFSGGESGDEALFHFLSLLPSVFYDVV
jgi:hypothetical protein